MCHKLAGKPPGIYIYLCWFSNFTMTILTLTLTQKYSLEQGQTDPMVDDWTKKFQTLNKKGFKQACNEVNSYNVMLKYVGKQIQVLAILLIWIPFHLSLRGPAIAPV